MSFHFRKCFGQRLTENFSSKEYKQRQKKKKKRLISYSATNTLIHPGNILKETITKKQALSNHNTRT